MAVTHPSPPYTDLTYSASARWVRGTLGGVTRVDSRHAVLVWQPGKLVPVYAFPSADVSLEAPDGGPALPATRLEDPDLADYLIVPWDALAHWYEEDEEVFVHPRDPFVRVDVLHSSRHVRVERDGHVIADTHAPVLLFETDLPTRYYLPAGDVDPAVLQESDLHTACPYKGIASYYDVLLDGRRHRNLIWHYPSPMREVAGIQGYLAPYGERVDLFVDGEQQERPAARVRRAGTPAPPS